MFHWSTSDTNNTDNNSFLPSFIHRVGIQILSSYIVFLLTITESPHINTCELYLQSHFVFAVYAHWQLLKLNQNLLL